MSHCSFVSNILRRSGFAVLLVVLMLAPVLLPAATTDDHGTHYITRSGREVAVFTGDLRSAGSLNLGFAPSWIVYGESSRTLYTSNGATLFQHDLGTGAQLRQTDLGGKVVAAAYDAQRKQLYVLDQDNRKLKVLDSETLKVRNEASLSGKPVALAFNEARGTIYIAAGKRVTEVSADTLRTQGRITDLDADAVDLQFSNAADLIVVQHAKWVSVYRLSDLKFRDYLPLEGHPARIQIDSAGNRIFVQLKDETDNIAVFDSRTLRLEDWINVGSKSYNGRKIDASSFTVDNRTGNAVFYDSASRSFFSKQEAAYSGDSPKTPDTLPASVTAGPDIYVNTTIDSGAQVVPNVEFDGYGNFAISWTDQDGNDGNGEGVFIRKFLADQTPVATEFHVNQYRAGDQGTSSLNCANNGDIAVMWRDASGRDGDQFGVYGRIINADNTFKTDDFQIPQTTAGRQLAPSIAGTPDGKFVAAWSGPGDGVGRGTWIRMYDADGIPLGNETLINTSIAGNTWAVDANMNRNGNFVVVWRDDSVDRIRGRAYLADGTPTAAADFQAGPLSGSAKNFEPSVTVFDDDTFVVIWREQASGGVIGQKFSLDQTAIGSPFIVSSHPTGQQFGAYIAGAPDGQFVVVWRDSSYPTDDIAARLFLADGTANGADFIVPDVNRVGDEFECTVGMDDNANFVVAYKDRSGPTSIAARYFMQAPPPTPMQITSIDPPGTANLGDLNIDVGINGIGFTSDAVVSFPDDANITVNSTLFVDDQNLTANISIGQATFLGLHDIKVTTGTGATTGRRLFAVKLAGIYPPATVTLVTPSTANQHATLGVTINGANFVNEPANTAVSFGSDITVSNVQFVNSTTLTAMISISGTAATGLRDVSVTNPGAAAGTCPVCFDVIFDPTLYADSFDDGEAADWSISGGSWNVNNFALQGQASRKGTVISPFAGCSICSIEADIKRSTNASAYVSLLGWYVDKQNMVEVRLDKDKQRWLLKQKVNGDTVAKAKAPATLVNQTFYHVILAFDGTNFTVNVDGNPLITVPAGAVPNGTVAFRVNGTIGTIDNVQVLP